MAKVPLEEVREIRFVVVGGANPGAVITFDASPRTVRIGRAIENDIVVNDATVSRRHASVSIQADGFTVSDEGSSAGTEKMGFRLGPAPEPLESGDELRVGDTILRFEVVLAKGAVERVAAREAEQTKPAAGAAEAKPGPLSRLGFDSTWKRIAGLGLVLALVGLLAWPEAPGLPPQRANVPRSIDYTAVVGFTRGARSNLDGAIFELPTDAEGLALSFDLLAPSGVEIRAERRPLATTEAEAGWRSYQLLMIPKAIGSSGPRARLSLDNLGYAPSQGDVDPASVKPWGVSRMWLARMASTASSPRAVALELESLEEIARRLDEAPPNRYQLIAGLQHASIGLMKLSGRSALLVPVAKAPEQISESASALLATARGEVADERPETALDAVVRVIGKVEGELAREYRRLQNARALAQKTGATRDQILALIRIARMIPEATDPRYRLAVSSLQKLGAKAPEPER